MGKGLSKHYGSLLWLLQNPYIQKHKQIDYNIYENCHFYSPLFSFYILQIYMVTIQYNIQEINRKIEMKMVKYNKSSEMENILITNNHTCFGFTPFSTVNS